MTPAGYAPTCRFCATQLDRVLVDLGSMPLANRNLRPDEVDKEQIYPLIARICPKCHLVQVDDSVPPEAIFSDYDYFSAMSDSWVAHVAAYADKMRSRFKLDSRSFVLEVASNDGCLLRHFVDAGIPVLGVEPAANVAKAARARGVPTKVAFFEVEMAKELAMRGLAADLTVANNVLAHVPGINAFVAGFAIILKPEGVATFEFPHLLTLIERLQFDTIYHEHFSYLSLITTEYIFAANGLRIFDVEELPTHGGSLRIFACRADASYANTARVEDVRQREVDAGFALGHGYEDFAARVETARNDFRAFIAKAKAEGRRIAAYGAAAKGNTFLNFCGASADDIIEVYDRAPAKQNKLLPGTHIPIRHPDQLRNTKPDYIVVLPWNLIDEIRKSMSHVSEWGGRFVTAIPRVAIWPTG